MRIAVTGASGLVGSILVPFLSAEGHTVHRVGRSPAGASERDISWQPAEGRIEARRFEGIDAVVHLAGESLASGRWTRERRKRIFDSRVRGTRLLSESLAGLARKPSVLVSASAVGYYGDRGAETLDEESGPGEGFLPEVCQAWEQATAAAEGAGIRVVKLRSGVVLSPAGGALARMLPVFRAGLGGRLGSGAQYMSWIAVGDLASVVRHVVGEEGLTGPVNAVSPRPITNAELTKALGDVLHRPTPFRVPAAALRLALGRGLADEALLTSQRVVPAKLRASGFQWSYPRIEGALRHLLGG
ncbi:MAG: TIGR01777 family oxidoreductase [Myxococcota bacterium]